ncbi:YggT family protein [Porticoccaceae bacterium nBUS_17]
MSGGLIDFIRLVIDLYATVILVRLLLQLVQADFFNPISQTIFKITAPIVEPLHKIFPTFGKFNTAALAAAILVKWSFFIIWFGFQSALPGQLVPLLLVAAVSLIGTLIQIYFYGILIVAISSWVGTTNHPTVRLVNQVIDPYMKPFRSVIPPIGMIDISPMVAILVLMVARAQVLPALNGIF